MMNSDINNPMSVSGCTEAIGNIKTGCGIADVMVTFRPHDDYKGDFGFDWMRNGDWVQGNEVMSGSDGIIISSAHEYSNNYDDYKKLIVHATTVQDETPASNWRDKAYQALEQEYRPIPINYPKSYEVNPNMVLEKTMFPKSELGSSQLNEHYYTHWLSLFPADLAQRINNSINHPDHAALRSDATLSMRIHVFDSTSPPDKVVFVNPYQEQFLVTPNEIHYTNTSSNYQQVLVTFTSLGDSPGSEHDMKIDIYAVKGDEMKLAGNIIIVKNHETKVCKEQDVVLCLVKTEFVPDQLRDGRKVYENTVRSSAGELSPFRVSRIHKDDVGYYQFLHQCLVYGKIILIDMDLTNDSAFQLELGQKDTNSPPTGRMVDYGSLNATGKVYGPGVSSGSIINPAGLNDKEVTSGYFAVMNYLLGKLQIKYPRLSLRAAVMFYFEEDEFQSASIGGRAELSSKTGFVYQAGNDITLPHEFGHSLGLPHPFDVDSRYIFINDPNSVLTPTSIIDNDETEKKVPGWKQATNNIMSYSHRVPFSTWRWQWEIVRAGVDRERGV